MFSSGIKGTQRCNGLVTSTSNGRPIKSKALTNSYKQKSLSINQDAFSKHKNSSQAYECNNVDTNKRYLITNGLQGVLKSEPIDNDFEHNSSAHSIIGLSDDKSRIQKVTKPHFPRGSIRATHHETLQRIRNLYDACNHYQQHWFSTDLERLKLEDRSREKRLAITRYELQKQLKQIIKSRVGRPNNLNRINEAISVSEEAKVPGLSRCGYERLVAPRNCEIEGCRQQALPCTRYCTLHIMHNADQVLFDYCTAKFADNTQCSVPVFDITHELPLCPEHARKRDNYKLYQEAKPKKLRKKVKPSAMIRPQKRNKKKKRSITRTSESVQQITERPISSESVEVEATELAEEDMVEQVLAMQEEPDGLGLVPDAQALVTHASQLLEETDISTVLSTIQADEFNDLFTVNRNGEYEPSREEAEELERALAAVDNDVKSLEKLSQSQGLLDSLLDEHTLVESLVQIPDMFHNGYASCGDSMVAQTSSRLLPVEPQSHS